MLLIPSGLRSLDANIADRKLLLVVAWEETAKGWLVISTERYASTKSWERASYELLRMHVGTKMCVYVFF
jgi:hypothetical protein